MNEKNSYFFHMKFNKKPELKLIESFIENNFKILKHIFIVVLSQSKQVTGIDMQSLKDFI